jgi:hypothetical protein
MIIPVDMFSVVPVKGLELLLALSLHVVFLKRDALTGQKVLQDLAPGAAGC